MSGSDSPPEEPNGERASVNRVKLWLLLEMDRHVLAAGVILGCFLALVGLSQVAPTSLRTAVANSDPVETAFQALLTAIITGVTLVVTITQFVLSQEQGPLGDQRSRMEGAMEYVDDVQAVLERPAAPSDPFAFERSTTSRTTSMGTLVRARWPDVLRPAREHGKTLYPVGPDASLAGYPLRRSAGTRRLRRDDPVRQRSRRRRRIDAGGVDNLVLLVAAAVTIALTPFIILLNYILRIVTVAKRTLAIGPLTLRETDDSTGEL